MDNTQNLLVWQSRWQAYNDHHGSYIGWIPYLQKQLAAHQFDRKSTVSMLLDCLQAFGKRQFDFFYDGFGKQQYFALDISDYYPVDYAFSVTLSQIGYDFEVIEEIGTQRIKDNEKVREVLKSADILAQNSVEMGQKASLVSPTAVLSYFHKSANIRVIPYAPIALVGIPNTAAIVQRDLLATPHEVGHYVYSNGMSHKKSMVTQVNHALVKFPDWLQAWGEEIFADIYGCLVAGPVAALSFQDLLLTHSLADFMVDDGEHPAELIRPYIYSHVLYALGFTSTARRLDERWQRYMLERGCPDSFKIHDRDLYIPVSEGRALIEAATDKLLNLLQPIVKERRDNPSLCWTQNVPDKEPLDTLYADFENATITAQLCQLVQDPTNPNQVSITSNNTVLHSWLKGETGVWLDLVTQPGKNKILFPDDEWAKVIRADGWATKGPDGNWPP